MSENYSEYSTDPLIQEFTTVAECVDFIVPFLLCEKTVIVHLNRLETDKGIVITDMPIFRYLLEIDTDDRDRISLNRLEFRDGAEYSSISINKLFGWVTSQNQGLGTLTSINLLATVYPHHSPFETHRSPYLERGGEHDLLPLVF